MLRETVFGFAMATARPELRRLVRRVLAGAGALLLMGHSPYRQWIVFRETHLIVVAGDDVPGAFAVAEEIARNLATDVPRSKALAARVPSAVAVMKLLRSRQLPLGLMPGDDARDGLLGRGRFSGEAPVPLRTLAVFGPYLLVALADFPEEKAQEIARALAAHPWSGIPPSEATQETGPPVPFHPGALSAHRPSRPAGE